LTIHDAFYRYAPPSDNNDTEAYIAAMTRALEVPSSTTIKSLSHAQLEDLSDAIKVHEGWREGQISGLDRKHMQSASRSTGAKDLIKNLIEIGSDTKRCADLREKAKKAMVPIYGHPTLHNACACTLSLFLQAAGLTMKKIIYGAGALATYLETDCKWQKVRVRQQQAGDVGVCRDADHIFLVAKRIDDDQMMIADNQESFAPHSRFASGYGGKTPVDYFLRAEGKGIDPKLMSFMTGREADDSVVTEDEDTDQLSLRFSEQGVPLEVE
jgi:hypothetical protein